MIPRVEELLIEALEARIVCTVPETAPSKRDEPETFVTTIESRKFDMCVQEQSNGVIYGSVEAELSVTFFSDKIRYDYSAMMADFARNRFVQIPGTLPAQITEMSSETALEGPYLTTDVWGFKVMYYITGDGADREWQLPEIRTVGVLAKEIFPADKPRDPNSPEEIINV